MGIFGNLFKGKENKEENKGISFLMPMNGEVIAVSDIPDPVFSQKMMGDGFGINPEVSSETKVYAPVSGEIASLFPTNHALGIKTEEGIEVLVHVGLDTVNLQGEGFTPSIKVGDKVEAGDLLLTVDLSAIESKVPSVITPIIFTAIEGYAFTPILEKYKAKDEIFTITKK